MTKLVRNAEYDKQPNLPGLNSPLEAGEDTFSLRGRDPLAPWLVEIWHAMSCGDISAALGSFYGMVDTNIARYSSDPRSAQKLDSAEQIVMDMRNWRIERGLK